MRVEGESSGAERRQRGAPVEKRDSRQHKHTHTHTHTHTHNYQLHVRLQSPEPNREVYGKWCVSVASERHRGGVRKRSSVQSNAPVARSRIASDRRSDAVIGQPLSSQWNVEHFPQSIMGDRTYSLQELYAVHACL